jgi:hypothetical protein
MRHPGSLLATCTLLGLSGCPVDQELHPFASISGDTGEPPSCAHDALPSYAAETDAYCLADLDTRAMSLIVEWERSTFTEAPESDEVTSLPIATTLTDDGVADLVFVTWQGWSSGSLDSVLRAVRGDDGRELWAAFPDGLMPGATPAAGDLDGDGTPEIVVATDYGVDAFASDGTHLWTSGEIWSLAGHVSSIADAPSLADLDGDGSPEIIVGNAVLDARGDLLWAGDLGQGGPEWYATGTASFAVDFEGDGVQEVVAGNTVYEADGDVRWTNLALDGFPAVADFDGDGLPEVVEVGQFQLHFFDHEGAELWTADIPGSWTSHAQGPPTVADLDGDGIPEIAVAAEFGLTVFGADGAVRWTEWISAMNTGTMGVSVFDFDGDGRAELVYADQENLRIFNGLDGRVKGRVPRASTPWIDYPIVADVDGDGEAEIVAGRSPTEEDPQAKGVVVYGSGSWPWQPARPTWNQYAYSVTNIAEDGVTVPAVPERNWTTRNDFRSADRLAGASTLSDLTLALGDACDIECDAGRVVLRVHAGNVGAADLPLEANAVIRAFAALDDAVPLASTAVGAALGAGEWAPSVSFDIEGAADLDRVVLQIGSTEEDCDPSNDTLVVEGPFCE